MKEETLKVGLELAKEVGTLTMQVMGLQGVIDNKAWVRMNTEYAYLNNAKVSNAPAGVIGFTRHDPHSVNLSLNEYGLAQPSDYINEYDKIARRAVQALLDGLTELLEQKQWQLDNLSDESLEIQRKIEEAKVQQAKEERMKEAKLQGFIQAGNKNVESEDVLYELEALVKAGKLKFEPTFNENGKLLGFEMVEVNKATKKQRPKLEV